ncbi:dTDP-4-dehydrorhamnose 3,5-epimerase [Litorimonas sp. RW-G-Af-16]|uniref:dTDP-4-dehydrorhamnose 3,5-epimerase n=1 Tax=Litorimonas sp. RW-G-Af-16 TaxID=3241168 RepID=UPI00390CAABA
MNIETFDIQGPVLLTPRQFADERGVFCETFRLHQIREAIGQDVEFVQENMSRSVKSGTVRGLHFQRAPAEQGKLVRCSRGRLRDVIVDLRRGSSTFAQHIAVVLDADSASSFWVPSGFAHGFITLEDHCEILYKTTDYYAPQHEGALFWADPELGIDWGISQADAIVSEKDKTAPSLSDLAQL